MTTKNNSSTQNKKQPKHFRDGKLCVTVWQNDHANEETGEVKTFYSLDLKRGYKSGNSWKNSTSVNGEDGLRVSNLFQRAHNWILQQKYPAQMQAAQVSGQ